MLQQLLQHAFVSMPHIKQVLLLSTLDLDADIMQQQQAESAQASGVPDTAAMLFNKATRVADTGPWLYECSRQVVLPTLACRHARVEDHDDLLPIVAAAAAGPCPSLAALPQSCDPEQPFALTRLIGSQDSENLVLVAEDEGGKLVRVCALCHQATHWQQKQTLMLSQMMRPPPACVLPALMSPSVDFARLCGAYNDPTPADAFVDAALSCWQVGLLVATLQLDVSLLMQSFELGFCDAFMPPEVYEECEAAARQAAADKVGGYRAVAHAEMRWWLSPVLKQFEHSGCSLVFAVVCCCGNRSSSSSSQTQQQQKRIHHHQQQQERRPPPARQQKTYARSLCRCCCRPSPRGSSSSANSSASSPRLPLPVQQQQQQGRLWPHTPSQPLPCCACSRAMRTVPSTSCLPFLQSCPSRCVSRLVWHGANTLSVGPIKTPFVSVALLTQRMLIPDRFCVLCRMHTVSCTQDYCALTLPHSATQPQLARHMTLLRPVPGMHSFPQVVLLLHRASLALHMGADWEVRWVVLAVGSGYLRFCVSF